MNITFKAPHSGEYRFVDENGRFSRTFLYAGQHFPIQSAHTKVEYDGRAIYADRSNEYFNYEIPERYIDSLQLISETHIRFGAHTMYITVPIDNLNYGRYRIPEEYERMSERLHGTYQQQAVAYLSNITTTSTITDGQGRITTFEQSSPRVDYTLPRWSALFDTGWGLYETKQQKVTFTKGNESAYYKWLASDRTTVFQKV